MVEGEAYHLVEVQALGELGLGVHAVWRSGHGVRVWVLFYIRV